MSASFCPYCGEVFIVLQVCRDVHYYSIIRFSEYTLRAVGVFTPVIVEMPFVEMPRRRHASINTRNIVSQLKRMSEALTQYKTFQETFSGREKVSPFMSVLHWECAAVRCVAVSASSREWNGEHWHNNILVYYATEMKERESQDCV